MIVAFFLLINILLAILVDAYASVKVPLSHTHNTHTCVCVCVCVSPRLIAIVRG